MYWRWPDFQLNGLEQQSRKFSKIHCHARRQVLSKLKRWLFGKVQVCRRASPYETLRISNRKSFNAFLLYISFIHEIRRRKGAYKTFVTLTQIPSFSLDLLCIRPIGACITSHYHHLSVVASEFIDALKLLFAPRMKTVYNSKRKTSNYRWSSYPSWFPIKGTRSTLRTCSAPISSIEDAAAQPTS